MNCEPLQKTPGALPAATAQPTVEESFSKCIKYAPSSKQAKELNHAVAYYIAKDMLPFHSVEKPGFQYLMRKAVPQYKVPSRTHFSTNEIPKLYMEVRASIEEQIIGVEWFGATTDVWTSSGGGGEPYISFTVHYVNADWELKAHCLEALYFPEDHTADHITEMVENMLQDWGLSTENLTGITTDNATNMKKAFTNFPCVWFSCFGHNLNLAISKVLKIPRVEKAVRACRHLVQAFSRSWKKKRELKKKQGELDIPAHALINDVVTRWGSTFAMISRFLEQQQAVCAVLAADRSSWHLMPSDSDITVLETVHELLKPLNEFTDVMASEKRVTLSSLKPVLEHIQGQILTQNQEDSKLTEEMKSAVRNDLLLQLRYTEEMKKVIDIACFIDPRFKGNFTESLEDTVKSCAAEAVALSPTTEMAQEQPHSSATAGDDDSADEGTSAACSRKKSTTLSGLLRRITKAHTPAAVPKTSQEKVDSELKLYLSLPVISADEDPLSWWKTRKEEMPLLSKLAKKFMCIPATSVPSERIFSTSGHIACPQRSRLSTENVNMLTFLHHNLQ
ncbi:E3 SUMO-protein ligase ZBED1-like isoform X2 [Acanthochromis polyacanthus]|uniref:E3 SUMO-protein ligase ZBED1-like isoform X2 n=1 Tax=Acanthochromis polyacanthus TaxID=80966 RepID=UPI002233F4F1|nr:E3 SUMO-protein ligase ZBED1-like isoform X2 [Acanthochromis polyacanthus]